MKTKIGMSLGLALILMVGVFATMLALGLFTTTEVRAQQASATRSFNPTTVAPGGTVTVTITVPDTGLGIVTETLPAGFDYDSESGAGQVDETNSPNIEFSLDFTASDKSFTYTVTASETTGDYDFSGVLATSGSTATVGGDTTVTVSTTTAPTGPTMVDNVEVDHTPGGVNDAAKVTVAFTVASMLNPDDSIIIVFSDHVQVPETLGTGDLTIRMNDGTGSYVAEPAGVTVDYTGSSPANDPRVTIDVGDMRAGDDNPGLQGIPANASVTITFRQGAGIRNPTEGGNRAVMVSTTNDSKAVESNTFAFLRTVRLNSADGGRGKTVTVTGKGFKNSTDATVWIDMPDANGMLNNKKDANETELCTGAVGGDDTFTCTFVVNASNFIAGEKVTISAVDGRAQPAHPTDGITTWVLKGTITAVPDSAAIGDTVTIEFRDFPAGETVKESGFKLGGVDISGQLPNNFTPGSSSNQPITVPDNLALGRQSLDFATASSGTRRDTMTILGAQVTVEPSTVVPNQSVTVTGRGFTGNAILGDGTNGGASEIAIGGVAIPWGDVDDGDDVEIDSGGNWVATVVIPVFSPATTPGTYELKATDSQGRPGATRITVADRTIEFTPEESRSGTIVTVSGAGWPASNSTGGYNSTLSVAYVISGDEEASVNTTPDSNGNFTADIKVPLNAKIPSTNEVRVSYTDDTSAQNTVRETAAHRVPGASIEASPSSGPGGTRVTLTGAGFKAFTSLSDVSVGGVPVQENPSNPTVGRDGVLQSSTFLIPGLDPGTHTIRATIGEPTVSVSFTITADDAPRPTTADQSPADAFGALIDNMVDGQSNLVGAFRYNEDTQTYQSYDPDPANAGFNDLDTVSSGDVFWVRLREDQNFLGKVRRAPWSQIVLP